MPRSRELNPSEPVTRDPSQTSDAPSGALEHLVSQYGAAGVRRALQRRAARAEKDEGSPAMHSKAEQGLSGSAGQLPHLERIQASFGRHDASAIRAHVGGPARDAAESIGAQAYATGDSVAFREAPDLHTAAHEAAHVIQQKAGVQLKGGVGQEGDAYERHADQVADHVVQGKPAEHLLDQMAGSGAHSGLQLKDDGEESGEGEGEEEGDESQQIGPLTEVQTEMLQVTEELEQAEKEFEKAQNQHQKVSKLREKYSKAKKKLAKAQAECQKFYEKYGFDHSVSQLVGMNQKSVKDAKKAYEKTPGKTKTKEALAQAKEALEQARERFRQIELKLQEEQSEGPPVEEQNQEGEAPPNDAPPPNGDGEDKGPIETGASEAVSDLIARFEALIQQQSQ